jgi:hypothetical protein
MRTVKHTAEFSIKQPVEVLFPLFSAEGERLWVPDWDYENIMNSVDLREDYVFLTRNHDHASTDAIWLVKRYEPNSYLVQFYKVEPGDKVGIITVQCKSLQEFLTVVEVSYEYVGLSNKGNDFIEGFSASEYGAFINEWQDLLERYFASVP